MAETTSTGMEEGTVYIREGNLRGSPSEIEDGWRVLSPEEHARAARFRHEYHRRRYVLAHAHLRQTLARLTGGTPEAFRFQFGDHGKPYLDKGPSFSLSHSGDRFLIGVSTAGRVGVDIEEQRPVREMLALARKKFSPEEVDVLLAAPTSDRSETFFRIWTLKEAYLKGVGTGLATRLDSFAVYPGSGDANALRRIDDPTEGVEEWLVRYWSVAPGALAAVAVDQPGAGISVVAW